MGDSQPNLDERKNELFATITLLAGVKRDIAAAQAAGHDAVHLYDRQAQLEADKERLSHEVNSEYMYRNLQAFMNRVDDAEKRLSNELGGLKSGQTDLQAEFRRGLLSLDQTVSHLGETIDQLKTTQEDHAGRIALLERDRDDTRKQIGVIETKITSLQREQRRLVQHLKISTDELKQEIDGES